MSELNTAPAPEHKTCPYCFADRRRDPSAALCPKHALTDELIAAALPLARFIEQFDRKPIKLADDFYGIHTGTEWEACLRLSDLRKLADVLKLVDAKENP